MLAMFALMSITTAWHFRLWPFHLCFALVVLMMLAVAWATAAWMFVLPFVVLGMTTGAAYALSLYYSLASPDRRGAMAGNHEALLAIGSMFGPIFGGAIMRFSGRPDWPFWLSIIPIGLIWLWAIRLDRTRNNIPKEPN